MTATITHADVVWTAKRVFPGLKDEHIIVQNPDADTGWCVTISFATGSASLDVSYAAGASSVTAKGGRLVDVALANLSTAIELRHFLEDCRESLAKNLEVLLTVALGPIHLLQRYEELEKMKLSELVGWLAPGEAPIERVFTLYRTEAERRRAKRAKTH